MGFSLGLILDESVQVNLSAVMVALWCRAACMSLHREQLLNRAALLTDGSSGYRFHDSLIGKLWAMDLGRFSLKGF